MGGKRMSAGKRPTISHGGAVGETSHLRGGAVAKGDSTGASCGI